MNIYVENDLFKKILINIVFISGKNSKIACIVFWFKNIRLSIVITQYSSGTMYSVSEYIVVIDITAV